MSLLASNFAFDQCWNLGIRRRSRTAFTGEFQCPAMWLDSARR